MKYSGIGGQAVMEGVMMRNGDKYAVAVRKPDQEIVIDVQDAKGLIKNKKIANLPIIRGMISFIDSMVVGMKTLMYSASFFMEEEEESQKGKPVKEKTQEQKDKEDNLIMIGTVIFSLAMSIGLFMVLPYFLSALLHKVTDSGMVITVAEAFLRLGIFLLYLILISQMKDIQRVFMYHGAEHKCINCIEHGMELNVENVLKSSRQHKRCGTSFLLIVIVVSIVFLFFIQAKTPLMRVLIRILLLPIIAGVSYEFIRLAGRSENKIVTILSKPGMWLQNLTTREPDEKMAEVAIASVEAVYDWRKFLRENFDLEIPQPTLSRTEETGQTK